jgi:hypothetical protein
MKIPQETMVTKRLKMGSGCRRILQEKMNIIDIFL